MKKGNLEFGGADFDRPKSLSFGGANAKGKRKAKRPLKRSKPLHVVIKSSKAKGPMSFLSPTHKVGIEEIVRSYAKKYFVRIERMVNVGTHLHIKLRFASNRTLAGACPTRANCEARALKRG